MVLAVERGRHSSSLVQLAAARAALWLYHDLPALLETLLFPDKVRAPFVALLPQSTRIVYLQRQFTGLAPRVVVRVQTPVSEVQRRRGWP